MLLFHAVQVDGVSRLLGQIEVLPVVPGRVLDGGGVALV